MTSDTVTLAGRVQELIDRSALREPRQAQIALVGASKPSRWGAT